MKTVYWQKYGLDKTLEKPLFDSEKLNSKSTTVKQIYDEISRASDEFERVGRCKSETFVDLKIGFILIIQWKPHNPITLVESQTDYINQIININITDTFLPVKSYLGICQFDHIN